MPPVQAPKKSGHLFKTLCIISNTKEYAMPTLNIYLDPILKETLDRLSAKGQRSATIRQMLNKYKDTTIGPPEMTRVKINISLSDEDKYSLDNLAKVWGVSVSEAINRMISSELDQFSNELTAGSNNKL
jgi:metal-responsive CopG/Arc/MetJ family transcriptional regulator